MEQPLSISILSYFKRVHDIELLTSNAELLLSTLKYCKDIHTRHKDQFDMEKAGGNNFFTILEFLIQDIHRIEQSHQLYVSKGNVITELTKQYKIEETNKAYTNKSTTLTDSDITLISKKLLVDLTSSNNSNNKKETSKQKAERLVNQQDLKDAIKKSKSR